MQENFSAPSLVAVGMPPSPPPSALDEEDIRESRQMHIVSSNGSLVESVSTELSHVNNNSDAQPAEHNYEASNLTEEQKQTESADSLNECRHVAVESDKQTQSPRVVEVGEDVMTQSNFPAYNRTNSYDRVVLTQQLETFNPTVNTYNETKQQGNGDVLLEVMTDSHQTTQVDGHANPNETNEVKTIPPHVQIAQKDVEFESEEEQRIAFQEMGAPSSETESLDGSQIVQTRSRQNTEPSVESQVQHTGGINKIPSPYDTQKHLMTFPTQDGVPVQYSEPFYNHTQPAARQPQLPPPQTSYQRPSGGRRSIQLQLEEERPVSESTRKKNSFFFRKSRNLDGPVSESDLLEFRDRGAIVVSWYEGTTSSELQDHVKKSVIRKLGLKGSNIRIGDIRIIDQSVIPYEEIVLTPYIPDGSQFVLHFSTRELNPANDEPYIPRPPPSPSAAPSPFDPDSRGLNEAQMQILRGSLLHGRSSSVRVPLSGSKPFAIPNLTEETPGNHEFSKSNGFARSSNDTRKDTHAQPLQINVEEDEGSDSDFTNPDDLVEERLRQLNQILSSQRTTSKIRKRGNGGGTRREEKRQVIFVISNYLVLFISFIAVSAEIQGRAPQWGEWIEAQLEHVQNCAKDRDALFECVEKGDFYGLIASFILWITRSATTKQIFLFGFGSTQKLWTVVYESAVTAVCWGTSYTFIRRGLNPDTRENFLQKYWKDALYGSLAGFNAAFMKAVLKNLIPQHVVGAALENALENRQLKIVHWFNQHFMKEI